ncbi:heme A synthase COX15 isoform X2 [Lepeophtheirus salmonis]|uniref:heme A synthase COX15 isoform X2 n=1 Tax=Lepeophtheirus salmonis TaxID=72036 RepID=UPI001AEAAE86|nr:cytochrome c oxidase assembly protein COX15 homolog isoform X2 [Lepeophtheirus salmonis]
MTLNSPILTRLLLGGPQFTRIVSRKVVAGVAPMAIRETPRIVGVWLGGCAGMCFGAVILGGLTRLTESGLSMTDWKLMGRPPPSNTLEWEEEFIKYQASPEFVHLNSDISLEDFKKIWYMEYGHRMWGRLIGAVYYIPAVAFWAKGYFNAGMKKRVIAGGVLLGFQGLLGWYMVKSGLDHDNFTGPSDVPRVSQYRLASHLSSAMILYSLLFWNSLSVLKPPASPKVGSVIPASLTKFRRLAMGSKTLVFLTSVSGAFVAGLDAGLVYNSFPLMGGKIIPDDIWAHSPFFKNFTENPTTVQFDHRVLGISTLALITSVALYSRSVPLPPNARKALFALLTMSWMQATLGITTLLHYVPISLAAAHQSGALITLSTALWLSHELKLMKVIKHIPK